MAAPNSSNIAVAPGKAPSPLQGGVVRSCPSGDTLVVRPRGVATPGGEKVIHIAGIAAPRLGNREREDEPFAFLSREFLRKLCVGKEIRYRVEYNVPVPGGGGGGGGGGVREFAHVFLPPEGPGAPDTSVSHKILAAGWAKVHDSSSRRSDSVTPEEDEAGGWKAVQRPIQESAQSASVGVWGPDDLLQVEHSLSDASAFLEQYKGKEIESIVEQVRDGSMLRIRMLLDNRHHQMVNLSLAGVKAPRFLGGGTPSSGESSEPFAEEARFFVESRLMQRNVKVVTLAMPQPLTTPMPIGSTATAPAAPAVQSSVLIGQVLHPVGDISQFLLAAGLAKCVDWHAGLMASIGGMEKYRVAEKSAKLKQLNIWKDYIPPARAADALPSNPAARTYDATIIRVISGDTIHVRKNSTSDSPEQRIHFSSVRQPAVKDPKQAGYASEAREVLRKRLVGKPAQIRVDYMKREDNGEERVFATVKTTTGSKEARGQDVGEMLVSRGLATVIRHRGGDEDRSPDWDKYMATEATAVQEAKGMHSGKEVTPPKLVEASESSGKANTYLPVLKRQGRIQGVVDFCASASRFKVIVPRESCRLTFVLAGIRAPRTARNASEKDEPCAREALEFTTARALQRDVDIEVLSTDKVGGFIGAIYLNKTENLALHLVEAGWASVHQYSADGISFGPQLLEAEKRARSARLGMWENEREEDQHRAVGDFPLPMPNNRAPTRNGWGAGAAAQPQEVKARTEYVDLVVSDVRGDGGSAVPFSFSVQVLDSEISKLEMLMSDLALHNKSEPPAPSNFSPKVGDWVSAKFSGDGAWYRGQVVRNKLAQKLREIRFIDYGNVEDVSLADVRPLDSAKFGRSRLPAKASEARLSFVKLFEGSTIGVAAGGMGVATQSQPDEYAIEALERFRDSTEGRKLIANIDYRDPSGLLHLTLYDPEDPSSISSGKVEACINFDLAREGHAIPDRKLPYWKAYPAMTKAALEANDEARRKHRGCFELGDPTGDE